jgi:feruloyl esterase
VLAACDALDGLKDGLISDPSSCHFDPQVMGMQGGRRTGVPDAEAGAIGQNHPGSVQKSDTGEEIFGTYQPGTELAWGLLIGGPDPYETALDQFRYMVFDDPKWDWRTFDVDRDLAKADQKLKGTSDRN